MQILYVITDQCLAKAVLEKVVTLGDIPSYYQAFCIESPEPGSDKITEIAPESFKQVLYDQVLGIKLCKFFHTFNLNSLTYEILPYKPAC